MALRFPRVNVHVLTVFLIVGVPIFVIGAFVAIGTGQSQLRQTYGQQLASQAEHAAGALDAYIYRRIIDASVVARVPDVRAAAIAGNQRPFDRAAAPRLAIGWMQPPPKASARADADACARASQYFKDIAAADPLFREILATDANGRVVASYSTRSAAFLADETWWQDARGDGVQGRVRVSDITWDKRERAYSMDIAAPIAAADETIAGVLRVVIDAREMLAMIAGVQPGTEGNSYLLRADGSLVYSRWPGRTASTFFAADLLLEKLRALRDTAQPARLYLSARGDDGTAQMVGLARSQLGLSYPNLSWLVAVSQPEAELFAPLRSTGSNVLLVLALTAVAVLGFTLWDSRRLAAEPEMMEADLHLVRHPRVHRIDEPDIFDEEGDESGRRITPV